MPERINAAHRLDQILTEASRFNERVSTAEAWTQMFGIVGRDANSTAVEVVHMVGLLRDQADEVLRKMKSTPVRPRQYEAAFEDVSRALDVHNLSAHWGTYRQYLRTDVLLTVRWCADTLPFEEDAIEPEQLAMFEEEVRQFGDRIAGSDLPDYAKSFMLRQVAIIEQAIREYPVSGARAFKHGYGESFINFTENQEVVAEYNDSEELEELRGFWSQMQTYAQKAGPWIAIGQAAAKVWEITGGGTSP